MEIKALETKLDSLTSIRTALTKGDNISPTNLDQMSKVFFYEAPPFFVPFTANLH